MGQRCGYEKPNLAMPMEMNDPLITEPAAKWPSDRTPTMQDIATMSETQM